MDTHENRLEVAGVSGGKIYRRRRTPCENPHYSTVSARSYPRDLIKRGYGFRVRFETALRDDQVGEFGGDVHARQLP